ncbi:MAG: hypothetical protein RIS76_364 [Verrucomicrobiota bacterium]
MQVYRVGESTPLMQWDTEIGSQLAFGSFQRWGVDGLALGTYHGLWLYRSPIVEPDATADWDGDGLPDAWEQAHRTDPHTQDAGADPDGDGSDNLTEWAAGTSPSDSTSRFELRLTRGEDGTWLGQFPSRAGCHYQMQSAGDLEGPWVPAGSSIEGTDASVTVPLPSALDTQWFRVSISMP